MSATARTHQATVRTPRGGPVTGPRVPETTQATAAGVPFRDAAQAWFWTIAALAARRSGTGSGGRGLTRPCDPDDVIRCLDILYRRGTINAAHARVLRLWGERGSAPDARFPAEQSAAMRWQEALGRLEWLLRIKGIVV